jgi:hypothetical protein
LELERLRLLAAVAGQPTQDLIALPGVATPGTEGIFGDLVGLTASLGSAALLACWVAEELWGIADERTHYARVYVVTNMDDEFVTEYLVNGPQWAEEVRKDPELREQAEPVWSQMASHGKAITEEVLNAHRSS